ncbi:MAG: rod shape-determining protein MreC [Actinomycetia bacterium]|nr:rod shape-determining protein MreC [Actinomycetes bacterium]
MLLLLVLTSITIVTLDVRSPGGGVIEQTRSKAQDAIAPVERATDKVFTPVGNWFDSVTNSGSIKAENKKLQRELAQARGVVRQHQVDARENAKLHKLLDLPSVVNIPSVGARVVATASGNFEQTFEIDHGSSSKVADGMPVVTGDGLIGRVISVSKSSAKVLMITDPQFVVSAKVDRSGAEGLAQGRSGRNTLSFAFVSPTADVKVNDLVVTSGLATSRFPPGIPVANVATVTKDPEKLLSDIVLKPVANPDHLDFVKVLLWEAPKLGS